MKKRRTIERLASAEKVSVFGLLLGCDSSKDSDTDTTKPGHVDVLTRTYCSQLLQYAQVTWLLTAFSLDYFYIAPYSSICLCSLRQQTYNQPPGPATFILCKTVNASSAGLVLCYQGSCVALPMARKCRRLLFLWEWESPKTILSCSNMDKQGGNKQNQNISISWLITRLSQMRCILIKQNWLLLLKSQNSSQSLFVSWGPMAAAAVLRSAVPLKDWESLISVEIGWAKVSNTCITRKVVLVPLFLQLETPSQRRQQVSQLSIITTTQRRFCIAIFFNLLTFFC